jgi:2-polyprenyl-3-methyl-5-hydroxy-6-metoxy-1,4-benzoquinol methylase
MAATGSNPYANIGFDDFKRLAQQPGLSKYGRIGFPDEYRAGFEGAILADIRSKLRALDATGLTVLDIGPGCSDLPMMLVDHCKARSHELILIDSAEMLAHLPDGDGIQKLAALFPNCPEFVEGHRGQLDVVLCYSVLHYVLVDAAFFRFLDASLSLLAPGGQFLIGDIPNNSKRKRFFASETGVRFHQQFMKTAERPEVRFNQIEHDQIDDSVVMALIQRARGQGFDAYVLPQDPQLPMANRREDILITRP